jgi:copper homeostasis protein
MSILVEAAVDSVTSAVAAERGGARRLELCDNLGDGGTTPSAGMISAVKAAVRIPVFVIIRPRGGGFVYTDVELGVMRLDIEAARMLGADGVVVGALTREARIDVQQLRMLRDAAGGMSVTFHRAFDVVRDQEAALETLIAERVSRVLTSGGAPTAIEGATAIGALVRRAGGQIEILAGGGVREENVQELVHRSKVREVHVRGTRVVEAPMTQGREGIRFRKPPPESEGAWEETHERRISEIVRLANG